jgi:hypothetical protein
VIPSVISHIVQCEATGPWSGKQRTPSCEMPTALYAALADPSRISRYSAEVGWTQLSGCDAPYVVPAIALQARKNGFTCIAGANVSLGASEWKQEDDWLSSPRKVDIGFCV